MVLIHPYMTIPFIVHDHPKPWRLNFGEIVKIDISDYELKVSVRASREDAEKTIGWYDNSALIELIDATDRPICDAVLDFSTSSEIETAFGLRYD